MIQQIVNSTAGEAALSKFFTTNTWNTQQIFKSPSATVAGGVFQSSGTVSAIPAGYGGSTIVAQFLAEESSAFPYTLFESTGNAQGHILALRQSRGTYSARTATQSGDILGQLDFGGHNSSALVNGKGSIRAVAAQTWTTTANGTNLEFYTTATGSTTSTLRLTLGATATFTTPVQATESQINGTAVTNRFLYWQTSGSIRWGFYANNGGESTGNVGSDLLLARYSDAGGLLNGAVLNINRATGNIITEGAIAIGRRMTSAVVALTDGANIALDASLGNHFRVTLAGNRTLNAPTNPVDGQRIHVEFIQDATGSRTITLTTGALGFAFGTDIPSITLTTTANLRDFIECVYNSTAQRWYVVRFVKGY